MARLRIGRLGLVAVVGVAAVAGQSKAVDYEYYFITIPADACQQVLYFDETNVQMAELLWSESGVVARDGGDCAGGCGWALRCPVEFPDSEDHAALISDFDAWGDDLCPGIDNLWLQATLSRRDREAGSVPVIVEDCIIEDGESTCDANPAGIPVNDIKYAYTLQFTVNPGDELCFRARAARIEYQWPDGPDE